MNKGRKQKLICGDEYELLYAKDVHFRRDHASKLIRCIKRRLNRRYRRDLQKDLEIEVNYAINEERQED